MRRIPYRSGVAHREGADTPFSEADRTSEHQELPTAFQQKITVAVICSSTREVGMAREVGNRTSTRIQTCRHDKRAMRVVSHHGTDRESTATPLTTNLDSGAIPFSRSQREAESALRTINNGTNQCAGLEA